MTTMNEQYSDNSDHTCCDTRGMCVTCGDCTCKGGSMTLDERAAEIFREVMNPLVGRGECIAIIRRALIEQDKITRHAAAEAVVRLKTYDEDVACYSPISAVEFRDAAHAAIMNCRGGVE
jgi:hypothetical protein